MNTTSGGGGANASGGSGSGSGGDAPLHSNSERTTTSVSSAASLDASSVSSTASSPVPPKKAVVRPTNTTAVPTGVDIVTTASAAPVAPQNPFDQLQSSPLRTSGQQVLQGAPRSPERGSGASAASGSSSTCSGSGSQQQQQPPASPLDLSAPPLASAPSTPNDNMKTAPVLPHSAPPHLRGGENNLQQQQQQPGGTLGDFLDPQQPPQQLQQRRPQTEQRMPATNLQHNFAAAAATAPPAQRGRSSAPMHATRTPVPQQPIFDDDENTEPSSQGGYTNNPADYPHSVGASYEYDPHHDHDHPDGDRDRDRDPATGVPQSNLAGSFSRFLEHTRRQLDSNFVHAHGGGGGGSGNGGGGGGGHRKAALSEEDDPALVGAVNGGALICGYLQKRGRNGKWQTRWFETDGECLSYYKSSKRKKLLATLDLEKVGAIDIDSSDAKGCSFSIQVLGRLYNLRAASRASCKDWVITLNRIKEARMNQGNVKLISREDYLQERQHQQQHPDEQPMIDLLDHQPTEDMVTPRVVVVANRQRTRAVDETQEWDQLIEMEDGTTKPHPHAVGPFDAHRRRSALGNVVLGRWTKQRPTLDRLGAKFVKWAKSLRKFRCRDIEEDHVVQLDPHVHPPGHDDYRLSRARKQQRQYRGTGTGTGGGGGNNNNNNNIVPNSSDSLPTNNSNEGLSGWIGKETQQSVGGGSAGGGGGPPSDDDDDDDGIVETSGVPPTILEPKPNRAIRAFSTASEDDARMIS